jgi:hypothetical protein
MTICGVNAVASAPGDGWGAGFGAGAGSGVEVVAPEGGGVVVAVSAWVVSEAYCSRAPSARALGPGAGSGWLSTGATGAESGDGVSSFAGVCCAAARSEAVRPGGGAPGSIEYCGVTALSGAGPCGWLGSIG